MQPSSGIQISSKVIYFDNNHNASLEFSNINNSENVFFKIKTSKLKTYDVKPPMGVITPRQKKLIEFKLIKIMEQAEMQEAELKDKFKIQFLRVGSGLNPKSKQQFKELWDQQKTRVSTSSYWNVTLPIAFDNGEPKLKTVISEPFSPLPAKMPSTKTETKKTTLRRPPPEPKDDAEMSLKFKELKKKEEELMLKREAMFKPSPSPKSGKMSGGSIALLVVVFLVSVVVGNFLKLRVFATHEM